MKTKKVFINLILYILITIVLIWTLLPIIWMVISSFRTDVNMFTMPPKVFIKPTLETYKFMFFKAHFMDFLSNSIKASLISTILSLVLGSMGGYALSRGKFKHKNAISFWIISTRMAPLVAFIVPIYMIMAKLRLVGTLISLIYAYTTFCLPFVLWMMMIFFDEVPLAIEESALIDGCSKFQTFLYVSLPIATSGLAATAVLCFMFTWNDYLYASILTGSKTQTITVATSLLITQHGISWGQAMATGTIIVAPMLLLGILVRKYLVRGLSMGAVK